MDTHTYLINISAHEYTYQNGSFAITVEPLNNDLQKRTEEVKNQLSKGEPTIPTFMRLEKKTNPFLRLDFSDEIRKNVNAREKDDDYTVFEKLRWAKDVFR